MTERTKRRRKRRRDLLTPAARWFLTGELQPGMNRFTVSEYDFALRAKARAEIAELLQYHAELVPADRLEYLQARARGDKEMGRVVYLVDLDVTAHWRAHGFEYPNDGVGILERDGEIVGTVDGVPVRRPGMRSRWLVEWLDSKRG